jgi:RHS repeat-associated protein
LDHGLTYLRARWYGPDIGRFINADTFKGFENNPISLNKYLGFNGNAVMGRDPSGYCSSMDEINIGVLGVLDILVRLTLPGYSCNKLDPNDDGPLASKDLDLAAQDVIGKHSSSAHPGCHPLPDAMISNG